MIRIITDHISKSELVKVAEQSFGDLVKAVVDIDKKIIAIGGEMHADEEAFLIERGSDQKNLWGINIYPGESGDDFIEFDSMINLRPSQGNRSRGVDDEKIRNKIREIVGDKITQK